MAKKQQVESADGEPSVHAGEVEDLDPIEERRKETRRVIFIEMLKGVIRAIFEQL